MAFLQLISLFPYNNWWRLGGNAQLKNHFGGICSLAILILVGVIFGFKLASIFRKSSITVSQTFQLQNFAGNYTFTTYQNDGNLSPFMLAINSNPTYLAGKGNLTSTDFTFVGVKQVHYSKTNSSNQIFLLEGCTANHFSKVPSITQNYDKLGMSTWLCLPLNKNFSFGGDEVISNHFWIDVYVLCKTAACKAETNSIAFNYYVLKNAINPYSDVNLLTSYISQQQLLFVPNNVYTNAVQMDLNKVITDQSLLPQTDNSQINSYTFNENIQSIQFPSNSTVSIVFIQRTRTTYIYKRSYEKLLDAVSYIGGIFQSFLALCIFMNLFNASYFEMKFPSKYFKCKEARNFYFGKFLKQFVYDLLHDTKFKPDWQEAEVRRKIQEAVISLQDIIYINRRIEFLERATNVLFQKHQLKGLSLLHNKTSIEVVKDYKHQKFRDRFIYFLKRHNINEDQDQRGQKMNEIKGTAVIQRHIIRQQKDSKKDHHSNEQNKFNRRLPQNSVQGLQSAQAIFKSQQVRENGLPDLENRNESIFDQIEEKDLAEYNNQESDLMLIQEIQENLKKLVLEAEEPTGDQRSKKILERMDKKLLKKLKTAICKFDPYSPIRQFLLNN